MIIKPINMRKIFLLILHILMASSCNQSRQENTKNTDDPNSDNDVKKELKFTDVIPNNLSDSLKAEVLLDLVTKIDEDTTLIQIQYLDSLGSNILAFYREDSLVKIITGLYPEAINNVKLNVMDINYNAYYFFMDTLISMYYECNRNQHTGRCNPVSASSKFYFYHNKIISQKHDVNIAYPYWACGCTDFSFYEKSDKKVDLELALAKELKRLRKIVMIL